MANNTKIKYAFLEGVGQTGIIGDIGVTNARFSLVTPAGIIAEM